MKAVYTALVSGYEELKEPSIITPGWSYICFSDHMPVSIDMKTKQPVLNSIWQIITVQPTLEPQRQARYIKMMPAVWLPQFSHTIWLDAAFAINCNLNELWTKFYKEPFSCPAHPIRNDFIQECDSCIANKRGDADQIRTQRTTYIEQDVPRGRGIITSGFLLRDTVASAPLCEAWWTELQQHSSRDQIAFAKVSPSFTFWTFRWDYSQSKELKHYKHFKHR